MTNYIIAILSMAIVFATIFKVVKDARTGSSNCGCNCNSCSSSKHCSSNK